MLKKIWERLKADYTPKSVEILRKGYSLALFKRDCISWFDSYDIYDEDGNTVFTVEGKLAWGHCLHILNAAGEHIATVRGVGYRMEEEP